MSKKKEIKDNNNYRTVSVLIQVVLLELFIIFAFISIFNNLFMNVVYVILSLTMFVMAYNNYTIFNRKLITWIYVFFGLFILISELMGLV